MCGLAGFVDFARSADEPELRATVLRMADTLQHRGPNDSGAWADPHWGLALGFRRLAILDLSPHGHQPMISDSGRYVLTFNGEIYNYAELRQELEGGRPFRGHSDTEVMLRAIETWGLAAAVRRFGGMFAFALWDSAEGELHLGRDRIGEKPLYYGWRGRAFLFGSELKAIRAYPGFEAAIDRDALAAFLQYGYVPAPATIYEGVFKLPAGALLTLDALHRDARPAPVPYWSARQAAQAGLHHPLAVTEKEAADELEHLLRRAVGQQMVADVPLGAFLSGGIDSSTIVALMQAQSRRPVKTFTIGFHEGDFDEARHARAVARHLGTEHTELYVTAAEARAVVPELPRLYDEPFADSSQIPTYLVSRLAAQHVTVSLSGDGGDELFAGYPWYFQALGVWNTTGWVPPAARRIVAGALMGLPVGAWDRAFAAVRPLLPRRWRRNASGDKVHKLAHVLASATGVGSTCAALTSPGWGEASLVHGSRPHPHHPGHAFAADPIEELMLHDLTIYLPDNILAKVDRASMGVSLESRAPLLDHRVVEFAWRVPLAMKVRDGKGKWLLRQVLYRHVPRELVERPKMGFCVPVGEWLRGPLHDWAAEHLAEDRLQRQGLLDSRPVRRKWEEHVRGGRNWQHHLWRVLMFQVWLDAQ